VERPELKVRLVAGAVRPRKACRMSQKALVPRKHMRSAENCADGDAAIAGDGVIARRRRSRGYRGTVDLGDECRSRDHDRFICS